MHDQESEGLVKVCSSDVTAILLCSICLTVYFCYTISARFMRRDSEFTFNALAPPAHTHRREKCPKGVDFFLHRYRAPLPALHHSRAFDAPFSTLIKPQESFSQQQRHAVEA